LPEEEQVLAAKRLGVDSEKKEYSYGIFKFASYLFPLVLPIVSSLKIDKYRKKMANKLLIANLRSEFNPDEFMCFKIIMGFFFAAISLYFYGITEEQIPYWKIPFIFVIGFFVPNLMLRNIIKKRQTSITRQLTFVIDLLTLSVEAGLDFFGAIQKIFDF
jgi:tight adherence protein C